MSVIAEKLEIDQNAAPYIDRNPFKIKRRVRPGPKKCFSSTRNNIHHYSSVIKKVLYQALKRRRLTDAEVNRTTNRLSKVTGLKNFVQAFWSPRVSNVLRESVQSGLFVRLFLETHIYDSNKCQGLRYLNRLFNSFHTGVLDRWVDTCDINSANQLALGLYVPVMVKEEAVDVKTQEPSNLVKQEAFLESAQLCKQEDIKVQYQKAMVNLCKEEYVGPYAENLHYHHQFVDHNFYKGAHFDMNVLPNGGLPETTHAFLPHQKVKVPPS